MRPNPFLRGPRGAPDSGATRGHEGPDSYAFLDFKLDARRQLLIRRGDEVRLRPRTFDVLTYLVKNPGRLIAKQELMDAVWADVAVTDDSLVQCLMEIRRELGGAEQWLQTVRGRGYLLNCEVNQEPETDLGVPGGMAEHAAVPDRSLERRPDPEAGRLPFGQTGTRRRRWLMAPGIGTLIAAAIGGSALFRATVPSESPASPVRFAIAPPPAMLFGDGASSAGAGINLETTGIALSPDGFHLAFVATDATAHRRIWLRPLAELDARPVPATDDATSVFWSPDSRSIGFFAGGKLKRLDLPGGAPVTLSDVPEGTGLSGTWGRDAILFAAPEGHEIFRVPTVGGSRATEMKPDASAGEISVGWPWFLPDGRRYLYLARLPDRDGNLKLVEPGKPPVTILSAISNAQWVDPDHLVFAREGTLVAQRFDLTKGRTVGDVLALAGPVQYSRSTARTNFSTSRTGVLVYQSRSDLAQLVWFDRAGQELGRINPQGDYLRVRLSPEGQRVVFHRAEPKLGTYDLWTSDLVRGVETRWTSDPSSEVSGVWLPSGKAVIFAAERGGPPHLYRKDLETGIEAELLTATQRRQVPVDISPDARIVAFEQINERGDADLWTLDLDGRHQPKTLIASTFSERGLQFSPDGRFVAFTSDESGRMEIYAAPMSAVGAPTRITSGGASAPRWSPDGRQLIYLSGDSQVMVVSIRTGSELKIGVPTPLFRMAGKWPWRDFDLSPDGTRLLAIVPQVMANEQPLTAVLNWTAGLGR